jgi:kelch-like protein 8
LLRLLKREFGFYCIELCVEKVVEEPEVAYAMGGVGNGGNLSSMERYDASLGQWSAVAAMGTARTCCGACVVAGELYVTGGYGTENRLSSVEKYTPSSNIWSTVVSLPAARKHHAAVTVGSAMYVLGGTDDSACVLASVLKFNSTQGTWRQVAPMPEARYALAACAVESDIFVYGGVGPNGDSAQASVFKFDTTNEWSSLLPMPQTCAHHSVSVFGNLVYIVGAGTDGHQVLRFDPATGAYSTLAPASSNRKYAACFMLRDCLYVAGGLRLDSRVECYDIASNTWTAVADMLGGRTQLGAAPIASAGPAEEQNLFDSLIAKSFSHRVILNFKRPAA